MHIPLFLTILKKLIDFNFEPCLEVLYNFIYPPSSEIVYFSDPSSLIDSELVYRKLVPHDPSLEAVLLTVSVKSGFSLKGSRPST